VVYNPLTAGVVYNSSDAQLTFSSNIALNFSYADVGKVAYVTATVWDASNNTAQCQFQVVVKGE
jgi:hypothetical protein